MDGCIYSVKDVDAGEFGPVFQAKNDAVARRQYYALLEDVKVSQESFRLFRLGIVDEHGVIAAIGPVEVRTDKMSESDSEVQNG